VERTEERYDVVVLDAYCSDVAPLHLFTVEMFQAVRRILNPGGIFAVQHIGQPSSAVTASLHRTLKVVFAEVIGFASTPADVVQPIVLFASDGPLRLPASPERGGVGEDSSRHRRIGGRMEQEGMGSIECSEAGLRGSGGKRADR
jgi:hypothetical protein